MFQLTKKTFKNKTTIIFDLDGTLTDSLDIWNKIDYLVIKKHTKKKLSKKLIEKERDAFLISHTKGNIYLNYCNYLNKRYQLEMDKNVLYKERSELINKLLIKLRPKKGVLKILKELEKKGYLLVLATATTNNEINIYRKNKYLKDIINSFNLILTANDTKNKKPNPEIYNKIIQYYKISKDEALIFEDSLMGLTAAKNAQIENVYVENRNAKNDIEIINEIATYKLKSYNKLYKIIKKL